VQTRVKEWTLVVKSNIESGIWPEAVCRLLDEIQPVVAPYGFDAKTLAKAFRETLLEIGESKTRSSSEDFRFCFIGLTLWRLFASGDSLWIDAKTRAGNLVPVDLMVATYSIWKNAVKIAAKNGIDPAIAAEILTEVTDSVADRMARSELDPEAEKIRDIHQYLFASFIYSIQHFAKRQGFDQTRSVNMAEWIAERELSDRGVFQELLESKILCKELLHAMPPRGRSVMISRHVLGFSWSETAVLMGSSINAAQKALSVGIRNSFGMCMQELRRIGFRKFMDVDSQILKRKKNRFSHREMTE
jgi:hypothetical protein